MAGALALACQMGRRFLDKEIQIQLRGAGAVRGLIASAACITDTSNTKFEI